MKIKLAVIMIAMSATYLIGGDLRFEFAKAAAKHEYVRCYSDGEPTTPAAVDVRSKFEGAASSVFVLALSCRSCDVNEIYVVIAQDDPKLIRVIHVDTED